MRIAVAGGTGTVGRHVVAHAQKAGHEAAALSRSQGVDVRSGEGLAEGLKGADVVIDVTHPDTLEQGAATDFWADVAGALQRSGAEQGVRHIVTLSINRQQEADRRNLARARQAQNESGWRDLAKGGKTANARPEI